MTQLNTDGPIFPLFCQGQNPPLSDDTRDCADRTVRSLVDTPTDDQRPGMLFGRVQSGKTRTFVSIICLSFDNGYDTAIVFTKGTKVLTRQTVARLCQDLQLAIDSEL